MSNVFFSSDIHFGHKNIIHHANRPFASVEEMNESLVERWNSVVTQKDVVYFAGDFSFARAEETERYFKALRGVKHLIVGNHDGNATKRLPWASVSDIKEVSVDGVKFVICHYPMEVWNGSHRGAFHVHGHSHGTLATKIVGRADAGVDCHPEYRPFTVEEFVGSTPWGNEAPRDHHGR
jgi:calcineurin-like phosphoesterase family protein